MRLPFNGKQHISSPYGQRTYYNTSLGKTVTDFHRGMDIVGETDTAVRATHSGTVAVSTRVTNTSDLTSEWGNYVRVDSKDGTRRYYCHMASRSVNVGDVVAEGAKLGVMGGTGKTDTSYAKHLHYEVRNAQNKVLLPYADLSIANVAATYTQDANTVRRTTARLNIRSAPDTYYGVVGQLEKGDAVCLQEVTQDGTWGYLAKQGWVCLAYTQEVAG